MKEYLTRFAFLGLLPLLLFFNNCDGGFKSGDGKSLASSTSCKLTAKSILKLSNFSPENDCSNAEDLSCEVRTFKPNVYSKKVQYESCIDSSDYGTVCLNLTETVFDTSMAQGTAEEYLPGGTYNYTEYNCYNKKLLYNSQPIFQSSEPSLEKALHQLHLSCMKGGDS